MTHKTPPRPPGTPPGSPRDREHEPVPAHGLCPGLPAGQAPESDAASWRAGVISLYAGLSYAQDATKIFQEPRRRMCKGKAKRSDFCGTWIKNLTKMA